MPAIYLESGQIHDTAIVFLIGTHSPIGKLTAIYCELMKKPTLLGCQTTSLQIRFNYVGIIRVKLYCLTPILNTGDILRYIKQRSSHVRVDKIAI